MLGFLIGTIKVLLLLGVLITIHEFGHFIVAKLCNMKVLKFSIGFGPKLIHKTGGETEYSLRLLPLRRICSTRR
jgi:regulator of sigma E protease